MAQSAFQQSNGGAGGGVFLNFTAGEAINGATDPKAVFVGTYANPQSAIQGRLATGGAVGNIYDHYDPGSNAVHSIDWSNKMFAYQILDSRTYNAMVFPIWNNGMSVSLTVDFYNTGVTTPTGSPFKSFSKTVSCPNVGGLDSNVYFFDDNVDCTATLGGGNKYWCVMTWGLGSSAVDIAPKINAIAPNFLEWNGAAWVTPFSSVQRLPSVGLFLIPTGGYVYQSKGDDRLDSASSNQLDEVAQGRARFLGFVSSNVAQGASVQVQILGSVGFTTQFAGVPGNPACIMLGTALGEVEDIDVFNGVITRLIVGNTYDAQNVIIHKDTVDQGGLTHPLLDGQYQ